MDSGMHPVYLFPSFRLSLAALSSQAGLLATGSVYLPEPSHLDTPSSGIHGLSSPGTAAGPRRTLTGFPIKPKRHLYLNLCPSHCQMSRASCTRLHLASLTPIDSTLPFSDDQPFTRNPKRRSEASLTGNTRDRLSLNSISDTSAQ